jgi:hypothetical protein
MQKYSDERQLSQEEKETIFNFLYVETLILNHYFLAYIDAGIRPPQGAIYVALKFGARNGLTEEDISEMLKHISQLPLSATSVEGTA